MVVGIETDRGPWVQALVAAGYTVFAVNPLQVARYRERHAVSGAKSDPGDAHVLAELVRLDRAHHRPVAGDSALAEQVKVLARSHQSMIWSRQRQANLLRSMLREFYPAALAAVRRRTWPAGTRSRCWPSRPHPEQGRALSRSRIAAALRRAGRQRNIDATAERIQAALRTPQLAAPPAWPTPTPPRSRALVAVIGELSRQIEVLRGEVEAGFGRHPDAEIFLSQPGLGHDPGRPGARRVRRRPRPLRRRQGPQELRRDQPRSPAPPAPDGSCWPATPATGAWPTRSTGRPSPP